MAKVTELPEVVAPVGDEPVIIISGGRAKRTRFDRLAAIINAGVSAAAAAFDTNAASKTSAFNTNAATKILDVIAAGESASALQADGDRQIRKAYGPGVTQESPRGPGERVGDQVQGPQPIIGGYVELTKDTLLNAIQSRGFAANRNAIVQWKVFLRDTPAPFNLSSTTAAASGTLPPGGFPSSDVSHVRDLQAVLFGAAGKKVFLFYGTSDPGGLYAKTWRNDAAVSRTGTLLSASGSFANWDTSFFDATAVGLSDWNQVALRLLMRNGEVETWLESQPQPLLVAVPPVLYIAPPYEGNIYYDTLVSDGAENWAIIGLPSGMANMGSPQTERYTLKPTGAQTGVVKVRVSDRKGTIQFEKDVTVRVSAANAQAGRTLTVLNVGDSRTAGGGIVQALLNNSAAEGAGGLGLTMIGTQGTGPKKYEAYSGWLVDNFTGSGSPFWNATTGRLDVADYLTRNGFAVPDYVFIDLLTNNTWPLIVDDARFQLNLKPKIALYMTLVSAFRAAGANIKIGVCLPPWLATQDGWAALSLSTELARVKRNFILMYNMLMDAVAASGDPKVYILGSNTNMDPLTAFPRVASLRHARIVQTGSFANAAAITLTPPHGSLYRITSVNEFIVKVGEPNFGYWRPATEADGVMRRVTDGLHPVVGGPGDCQLADGRWGMMKVLG